MRKLTPLSLALVALAWGACGGDSDKVPDTGTAAGDAGNTERDSGTTTDAGSSKDAAAPSDSATSDGSASDAAVDAGQEAGTGAKVLSSVAGGAVTALPDAGAAAANAKGAALLVRTLAGHGLVSLQVSGLDRSRSYPAHVHVASCATGAGGHYLLDPDAGTGQANEVWPSLMTDDAGQARAFVDVNKVLRDDAKAIVVHDPDAGTKMLCADLTLKAPYTTTGSASALPGADAGVANIMATGTMTRSDDGKTTVQIKIDALQPSTMYKIHVHDQACAAANGGGHYKLDYAMTTTVESNEIWLDLTTDATGKADKTVTVDHVARAEAQAIVIHAMDATRLACIDLKM